MKPQKLGYRTEKPLTAGELRAQLATIDPASMVYVGSTAGGLFPARVIKAGNVVAPLAFAGDPWASIEP